MIYIIFAKRLEAEKKNKQRRFSVRLISHCLLETLAFVFFSPPFSIISIMTQMCNNEHELCERT